MTTIKLKKRGFLSRVIYAQKFFRNMRHPAGRKNALRWTFGFVFQSGMFHHCRERKA